MKPIAGGEMHTYKSIAKDAGREKRTVQGWYQKYVSETGAELGRIDDGGTRVFTDEERRTLLGYGSSGREKLEFVANDATEEAVTPTQIIELGTEQFDVNLAIQNLDGASGLGYENPQEAANMISLICNGVLTGMRAKVGDQEDSLAQTRQAMNQAKATVEVFEEEVAYLSAKSKSVAQQQTKATTTVQHDLQKLASLGKQQGDSQ